MDRKDVTQAVVLDRLLAKLRESLGLDDRRCYETLDTPGQASSIPGGDFWVTVWPGPGVFKEGEQAIGNVTEEWTVTVTIYSRIRLDSTGHDRELLRNSERGLYVLKAKVLQAVVGQDLVVGEEDFLRQWLYAKHCSQPQKLANADQTIAFGILSIEFGVSWDWDLVA